MPINPMDYSGKDTVLDVVRTERARFYNIIDDPDNWNVQTRCSEWEVRDIVGHMIDVTEGYLSRWDIAHKGEAADALGWQVMSERLNENAQAFRSLSREEAISRLKADSDTMLTIFEALTPDEWANFMVTHPYTGPTPAFCYPAFQVMDYGVHTWDMKWGLGEKDGELDERTAGVLVPYMFIIMQSTVDQESAKGVNVEFGDNLDGVQAVFHFKSPSDFVLTTYQRFPGGETSGDPKVIDQVRHLFFKI